MGMGFGLANIGANALGGFTQGVMARDDRDIKRRKVAVEEGQLGVMQNRDKREQRAFDQEVGGNEAIGDSLMADAENIQNQGFYIDPTWSNVLTAGDKGQYGTPSAKKVDANVLGFTNEFTGEAAPEPAPQNANAVIAGSGGNGGGSVGFRGRVGGKSGGDVIGKPAYPMQKSSPTQPGGMQGAESLIAQANKHHDQIVAEVQKAKLDLEDAQARMSPDAFLGYKKQRTADLGKRVAALHQQGADLANKANEQIYNRVLDRAAASVLNGQKDGVWKDEESKAKAAHYLKAFGYSDEDIDGIQYVKRPGEGKDEIIIGGDRYTTGDLRTALVGSPQAKSDAINKYTGARVAIAQAEASIRIQSAANEPPMFRALKIRNTVNEVLEAMVRDKKAVWVPNKTADGRPTPDGSGHFEPTKETASTSLATRIRGLDNTRISMDGFVNQRDNALQARAEMVAKQQILASLEAELKMMSAPGAPYTAEQIAAKQRQVDMARSGMLPSASAQVNGLVDPTSGNLF